jgi:hypothetical protein
LTFELETSDHAEEINEKVMVLCDIFSLTLLLFG